MPVARRRDLSEHEGIAWRRRGDHMASARPLIGHDQIREWAEARRARPACVKRTGGKADPGMIRLDFPGFSGRQSIAPISWNQWFKAFDQNGLALLVQDTTARGQQSNFNKLVSRDSVERNDGRRGNSRSASGRRKPQATRRQSGRGSRTQTAGGSRAATGRSSRPGQAQTSRSSRAETSRGAAAQTSGSRSTPSSRKRAKAGARSSTAGGGRATAAERSGTTKTERDGVPRRRRGSSSEARPRGSSSQVRGRGRK
jgi:hypothetical protein